MDFISEPIKKPKFERVVLAEVYLEDGKIGFRHTGEGNPYEVKYFLESMLKCDRQNFESQMELSDFSDER